MISALRYITAITSRLPPAATPVAHQFGRLRDRLLSPDRLSNMASSSTTSPHRHLQRPCPSAWKEANSFYNGGAENVSDTFASALWSLDFLHWWAAHGCHGINLHTVTRSPR